jgi:stage II sporulation protein M
MASFIILPMSGVIQGESVLIISHLEWVLWGVAAALAVVAALLVRLGIAGFSREGILAKDSRPPDGRAILRAVGGVTPQLSPRRLPREVLGALSRSRGAIVSAALLLVGGMVLGVVAYRLRLVPSGPLVSVLEQQATAVRPAIADDPTGGGGFPFIAAHNLLVGLLTGILAPFSLGALGGLTVVFNGFLIGYIGGGYADMAHGLTVFTCAVAPHGVVELPALVLAAGFALRVGASMVRPSPAGWLAGMRLAVADYARGMLLWVPLFLLAAALETYVTPAVMPGC